MLYYFKLYEHQQCTNFKSKMNFLNHSLKMHSVSYNFISDCCKYWINGSFPPNVLVPSVMSQPEGDLSHLPGED